MKMAIKITGLMLATAIMTLSSINLTACTKTEPIISLDNFFNGENILTVVDNTNYYSETVYFKNEKDFFETKNVGEIKTSLILHNTVLKNENFNSFNETEVCGKFIVGVKKLVCVSEVYSNDKLISDKLLGLDEIKSDSPSLCASLVGADSESKYYLEIDMMVVYNNSAYDIAGNAKWKSEQVWGGEKHPEDSADDFMALTWGGNGEFKAFNESFSGSYRDETSVNASRCISNTYGGFCWQFREKTGLWTSAMESASCFVQIEKTYNATQNKETNAVFTYIHTYNHKTPSVEISIGGGGLSGGISVSGSSSFWQIQIDVPGLRY